MIIANSYNAVGGNIDVIFALVLYLRLQRHRKPRGKFRLLKE